MQNKGKVNTEPFLKLTELLAPWCCIQHDQTAPQNLKNWNMGKPRVQIQGLILQISHSRLMNLEHERSLQEPRASHRSSCKAQCMAPWLFGPCSISSAGVGWGTEALNQTSRKPLPITCRDVPWWWRGWRHTPWVQAHTGAGPWRRWEPRDGGGSRTEAALAQTDGSFMQWKAKCMRLELYPHLHKGLPCALH